MIKKMKSVVAIALVSGMIANVSLANAYTKNYTTPKGTSGESTDVACTLEMRGGSSTFNQAYLEIKATRTVEELGIKDISVVKKDGGGVTGKKVSQKNAKTASYTGPAYGPDTIKTITGHFYVTSAKYGNLSEILSQ